MIGIIAPWRQRTGRLCDVKTPGHPRELHWAAKPIAVAVLALRRPPTLAWAMIAFDAGRLDRVACRWTNGEGSSPTATDDQPMTVWPGGAFTVEARDQTSARRKSSLTPSLSTMRARPSSLPEAHVRYSRPVQDDMPTLVRRTHCMHPDPFYYRMIRTPDLCCRYMNGFSMCVVGRYLWGSTNCVYKSTSMVNRSVHTVVISRDRPPEPAFYYQHNGARSQRR